MFISSSIKDISVRTYESAWRGWVEWCNFQGLDRCQASATQLVQYLWFLFSERNLSASTLGVHRAAISSFTAPLLAEHSQSHLLQRFMWAVFLVRPLAAAQVWETWDVAAVLEALRAWGPIQDLSLHQLSHRTLALILIFSCHRISDLKLLGCSPGACYLTLQSCYSAVLV